MQKCKWCGGEADRRVTYHHAIPSLRWSHDLCAQCSRFETGTGEVTTGPLSDLAEHLGIAHDELLMGKRQSPNSSPVPAWKRLVRWAKSLWN